MFGRLWSYLPFLFLPTGRLVLAARWESGSRDRAQPSPDSSELAYMFRIRQTCHLGSIISLTQGKKCPHVLEPSLTHAD